MFDSILVTGGAGFIGSHFIRLLLEETSAKVINLDALTYAGNLENLRDKENHPNYRFVKGDIRDPQLVAGLLQGCQALVNFAAESHVDRSILGPAIFTETNVLGTHALLEAVRQAKHPVRMLQVSTDEVYGTLGATGLFAETTPLAPNSPYSASKAAADLLCRAYFHTFRTDVITTRCGNNYGPNQFPEKFIPLMICNLLKGDKIPVYGNGKNIRDWVHVKDHCRGILAVLNKGQSGEIYNIGATSERENIEVARRILEILGKTDAHLTFVKDRPGHDQRYALDASKIKTQLNWVPTISFDIGIKETVEWYKTHADWVNAVTSGSYRSYYKKQYSGG